MTHQSHTTRYSDSSLYDEVCKHCGGTDAIGDSSLNKPCPNAIPTGIYFNAVLDNFYNTATKAGQGNAFYEKWKERWREFPSNGNIVVDIAKAVDQLESNPELADKMSELLNAAPLQKALERIEKLEAALKPFAEAEYNLSEHDSERSDIWEHAAATDITVGRIVGRPGRKERWLIGYSIDSTINNKIRHLISLEDGMVQEACSPIRLAQKLNASGELPAELLP